MFQNACEVVSKFILPIYVACQSKDEEIEPSILGAAMLLNDQGWLVTAGHNLELLMKLDRAQKSGDNNTTTYQFGHFSGRLANSQLQNKIDLGIGQISGYSAGKNQVYAVLRVKPVMQGELLCRIGYPSLDNPRIHYGLEGFEFEDVSQAVTFANEAFVSRLISHELGKWIETSSPALMGQSGGPLVDPSGYVCGIQTKNKICPQESAEKVQTPSLHTGIAVDIETVRDFLNQHEIAYLTEK